MQLILSALAAAIPSLKDTLWIFIIFSLIFSLSGLSFFHGIFKYNCLSLSTGVMTDTLCNNFQCEEGALCARGIANPNYGLTNFDTFGWSLLMVF